MPATTQRPAPWRETAGALCRQGDAATAAGWLADLASDRPDDLALLTGLGDARILAGDITAAVECYERVLAAAPDDRRGRAGLVHCLSRRPALALRPGVRDHLWTALADDDVVADVLAPAVTLQLHESPSPIDDPRLLMALHRTAVADLAIEGDLTRARRDLCLAPPPAPTPLALALTAQCRLTEFAWAVSPEERALLPTAPDWVRAMYGPDGVDRDLVDEGRAVPTLTPVTPGTSQAVRDQYQANPYPRWRQLPPVVPWSLDDHLRQVAGGSWDPPALLRRPRLLVAGCGTGRELLLAARAWQPSTVTAFDLSGPSLAYARRKADEYGVDVELFQADLLQLDGWDREFDAVICTGVLHHLDDPIAGWRTLTGLLRPGGVMLVGLYSETARRGIVEAQRLVRDLGLTPTPDGIRAARAAVAALPPGHPARDCAELPDFFYSSGCRDLLFHVREHRFTGAALTAALAELGLTFRGFEIDSDVRARHRTLFGAASGLAGWAAYERLYPLTFLGMYQFWCQRDLSITTD